MTDKEGLFEMAEGGSLLLDEIGEMPPYLQTKLLRVLQEREYRPIGSDRIVHVDFRLICATNIDLDMALREGQLREDLYFRINTITLRVPPLRERTEDIPLLCDYFLEKFRQRYQKNVKTIAPAAYHLLIRNRWPGNVRELENAIERGVLVAKGSEITVGDLPESIREESSPSAEFVIPPHRTLAEIERMAILQTLQRTNWNKQEAAAILGLYRPTLYSKMKKHEIKDLKAAAQAVGSPARSGSPALCVCGTVLAAAGGADVPVAADDRRGRDRPSSPWVGRYAIFGGRALRDVVRPPYEGGEIARQIYEIGWRSVPLIASSGFAIGVVLSMHTRASLERFGAEAMIPAGLAIALIRETGPLTAGLLMSGRVGAGIGAELGAMRVTEQIDALEASAVDSFKFLAVTRILACMIAMPLLTVVMDFAGHARRVPRRARDHARWLRPLFHARLLAGRVPGLHPGHAEDGGLRVHHRIGGLATSGSRPAAAPRVSARRARAASCSRRS